VSRLRRAGLAFLAVAVAAAGVALEELRPWNWRWIRPDDPARTPSDFRTFTPARRAPLVFDHACDPVQGELVVVGALGDMLFHNLPHKQAMKEGFSSLWAPMADLIRAPDVTYANLEGTLVPKAAWKKRRRSNIGNRVAYHESLAKALVDAGVDVVSTANNHAVDRWSQGIVARTSDRDDVRRRVLAQLSSWNEADPAAPLDVVPQCRAGFVDPPVVKGKAGDACDTEAQCDDGLRCVRERFDGRCEP
jgi:hypothetical protein